MWSTSTKLGRLKLFGKSSEELPSRLKGHFGGLFHELPSTVEVAVSCFMERCTVGRQAANSV